MPKSRSQARKREILYLEHPYCYWCGVFLDPPWMTHTPYAATIDHINHVGENGRVRGAANLPQPSVLSCQECNHYRNWLRQTRLRLV